MYFIQRSSTAFSLLVLLTAFACAAAEPVTLTFQVGQRGYTGARTIKIEKARPDAGVYGDDFWVGQVKGAETHQVKTLLKFMDWDIPADAEVVSARICMMFDGVGNRPELAVHGMLKDWTLSPSNTEPAQTSWNHRIKPDTPWGAPGAGKAGSAFVYDGAADYYDEADSSAVLTGPGVVCFDVTRSFASQLAAGKNYGWVFIDVSEREGVSAHATMPGSHALVVEVVPSEANPIVVPPGAEPRLITFHLAEHYNVAADIGRTRELPFEGAVFFGVGDDRNGDGVNWLSHAVFAPHKLAVDNYLEFISNAKRIYEESPLKYNFVRLNLAVPGTLAAKETPYSWSDRPRADDPVEMWWSDAYEIVLHNVGVAAEVARRAKMRGLLLDFEVYGGNVWRFATQRDAHEQGKTLAETKERIQLLAKRTVEAINEVFADVELLVIPYGYDRPRYEDEILWLSFFDGLFEGCGPQTRIIEGNEHGYYINCRNEFQEMYDYDYGPAVPICAFPEKYRKHLDVGFGLWIDRDGWGDDPEVNASSASWQFRVENAMAVADSYVWVFTNRVDWWGGTNLPQAYVEAMRTGVTLARRRR